MYKSFLLKLFIRDLNRLSVEIESVNNEQLYQTRNKLENSIGNLALHICGNLSHFIAHVLGKDNYSRERDNEFKNQNFNKDEILNEISQTILRLEQTEAIVNNIDFTKNYPIRVFTEDMTIEAFLIHLYGHLNYHLGQINYLRRIL